MKKYLQLFLDAVKGKEENFTKGSINRAIVLLSIPMILEMVMESLFAVVDAFFVAKIGVEAIATVGLTETVITLVYSVAIGLSMAATAMIARRIGENDPEEAAKASVQAIIITLFLSAIIGVLGVIYAEEVLRFMGGDDSLIASGKSYTQLMLGGNVVIMLLFLLNGIFRGAGNASIAMSALWIANISNIILDPLLIFGIGPFPEMGVTGAAVATNIGRGIGVAFQIIILLRGIGLIKIFRRHLVVNFKIITRILNVAWTGTFQFLISSASWIVMMRIIAQFGSEAVAGYTIAIRIIIFTILPSWGLANAAATLVGQNLGAKQPQRAETSVWRAAFLNMVFLATVSVIFIIGAPFFIGIFTSEPAVVEAGVMSLRIICLGYIFFAYGMVLSQAFNGAGDTRTPTIINFVAFWLVEIPLGYLLAIGFGYGLAGVCFAIAGAETLQAVICIIVFKRGKWKSVEI